jgi:hypothetical protein
MRTHDDHAVGIASALDAQHILDHHAVRRARAGEASVDALHGDAAFTALADRLELPGGPVARRADAALGIGGGGGGMARAEADQCFDIGLQPGGGGSGGGRRGGGEQKREDHRARLAEWQCAGKCRILRAKRFGPAYRHPRGIDRHKPLSTY